MVSNSQEEASRFGSEAVPGWVTLTGDSTWGVGGNVSLLFHDGLETCSGCFLPPAQCQLGFLHTQLNAAPD